MPHLVTNFLLAIKKSLEWAKQNILLAPFVCPQKQEEERDFVETSKEKSSMNYFMHSIYLCAYFYKKKNYSFDQILIS